MTDDVLDRLAGLAPDSPVALLRRQRPDFVKYTQGSHDVMITPAEPGTVSLAERAAVALQVAQLTPDDTLAAHYSALLRAAPPSPIDPRRIAVLQHAAMLTTAPGTATKANLDRLRDLGMTPKDVVTISQIVAFVSYQARVAAGMRILAAGASA
jgi:uncharacterized protein YciW